MSHFLTLVLINADEPNPAEKARQLMWPYFVDDFDDEVGKATSDAKFSGFTIGGRFDGEIWGKEQHYSLTPNEFQKRYGLDVVKPEDNIRPLSELVPDCVPYAVITPDGSWHDVWQVAQGASVVTEHTWLVNIKRHLRSAPRRFQREAQAWPEWVKQFRSLSQTYEGCIAVAFDCHC